MNAVPKLHAAGAIDAGETALAALAREAGATAAIADACVRLGIGFEVSHLALRRFAGHAFCAGPARPVRHFGSVDVFLALADELRGGEIVVIDNGGNLREGCIGDLTALELQQAGAAGVVVWGAVRDVAELRRIDLPVHAIALCPAGPHIPSPWSRDAFDWARLGELRITRDHYLALDDDGVIVIELESAPDVLRRAAEIRRQERHQVERMQAGTTLREQFHFAQFRERRAVEPDFSFRRHLHEVGGAIEI
jgi:regulator of RNase E activity RraA